MPVFAVIRQSTKPDTLGSAIVREFPDAHYDLGNGVWLVAGAGTAKEISDKLKITPEAESGTGLVLEAASYYGRANPAIWTWIKTRWEGSANGR
jgi:cobalamin biosynthesis protein CbiD